MYCLSKICYTCMNTSDYVKSFKSLDKDSLTILRTIFAAVSKDSSNMYICIKCFRKLQRTSDFINQCRKSCKLLKHYIHQVQQNHSSSEASTQLYVAMVDFKKYKNVDDIIGQSDYPINKIAGSEIKTECSASSSSDIEVYVEDAEQDNFIPEFVKVLCENVVIKTEYCNNNDSENSDSFKSDLPASHDSANDTDIEIIIKTETVDSSNAEINSVNNEIIENDVEEELSNIWMENLNVEPLSELNSEIEVKNEIINHSDMELKSISAETSTSDESIPELSNNIDSILEIRLEESDLNIELETTSEENNTESVPETMERTIHKCTKCLKVFSGRRTLIYHKKSVKCTELNFKCVICNMAFRYRAHLLRHLPLHTGEKPYKCVMCDTGFMRRYSMAKHMRKFHENSFTCPICNDILKGKACLEKHMELHREDRAYSCPLCSKRYVRHTHLTRHLESHDL